MVDAHGSGEARLRTGGSAHVRDETVEGAGEVVVAMVRHNPALQKRKHPDMEDGSAEMEIAEGAHESGETRRRTGGDAHADSGAMAAAGEVVVAKVRQSGVAANSGGSGARVTESSTGEETTGTSAGAHEDGADDGGSAATGVDGGDVGTGQPGIAGKRRRGVEGPNLEGKHARRRSPRVAAMEAQRPAPAPAAAGKARKRRSDAADAGGTAGRKRQQRAATTGAAAPRVGYVQRTGTAAGPLKYMIKIGPTMVHRMEESGRRRDATAKAAAARQTRTWDDGG